MSRDNNFIFLRFYAAVGVLFGHVSWHMGIAGFGYEASPDKPFFHVGVPFFFVLTGFFLYSSYVRMQHRGESVKKFLLKRYIRIAPSIYFYVLVATVVLLSIGAVAVNSLFSKDIGNWLIANLILLPIYHPETFDHIGVGALNGSLWTIVALISFYIAIPFIFLFEKKFGFRKMMYTVLTVATIGMVLLVWLQTLPDSRFASLLHWTFIPHLIFFGLGILWARVWDKTPKNIWIFIASLAMFFLLNSQLLGLDRHIGDLVELLWAVPFSYAIVWFGLEGFKFFRIFNKVEDLGMGIYIWHMLIVNVFLYLGLNEINWLSNPLMHLLVLGVTLVMAYMSRILVEKPSIRLFEKQLNERQL